MGKEVKIWYYLEGDYREVLFERKAGYFRETENDAVMEKVRIPDIRNYDSKGGYPFKKIVFVKFGL